MKKNILKQVIAFCVTLVILFCFLFIPALAGCSDKIIVSVCYLLCSCCVFTLACYMFAKNKNKNENLTTILSILFAVLIFIVVLAPGTHAALCVAAIIFENQILALLTAHLLKQSDNKYTKVVLCVIGLISVSINSFILLA